MGVLPEPSLAEGPKIEQSTFLIEVRLEKELVWPVLKISLRIHELLAVWLHWWNWSTAWLHGSSKASSSLHRGIVLLLSIVTLVHGIEIVILSIALSIGHHLLLMHVSIVIIHIVVSLGITSGTSVSVVHGFLKLGPDGTHQ